jgi:glycosyltransferase involved in cell wall biosynthesis
VVAGKPVLVSNAIAMADFVRQHRCGIVLGDVSVGSLKAAIIALTSRYQELACNAAGIGAGAFSLSRMVESHRRIYNL